MANLTLTIFIYQLLAALGVLTIAAIVVITATTDFQLMFMQGPADKMLNWKHFQGSRLSKITVILVTVMSIGIMFLPTFLVFATDAMATNNMKYYLTDIRQLSQDEPLLKPRNDSINFPPSLVRNDYPPFDDFRTIIFNDFFRFYEYRKKRLPNEESIFKTYLHKHFNLPVDPNNGGIWYGVLHNLTQLINEHEFNKNYRAYSEYQRENEAPNLQRVDAATGIYYTDDNTPTYAFGLTGQNSFSLQDCNGQLTFDLPDFDNHKLLAVSNVSDGVLCYPQFDASLPITVHVGSSSIPKPKSSVLDDHYGIFRTVGVNTTKEITSALSVSAMHLNSSSLTMAIKKSTHIIAHGATFNYVDEQAPLINCSSANLDSIFLHNDNTEFNSYNHTRILCQLKQLAQDNPGFSMLQATRRSFNTTSSMNSIYTYTPPTPDNPLGGIAVDLTWFTVYALKSPYFNLPIGEEHLIAHVYNDGSDSYSSIDSVEELIERVDIISVYDRKRPTLPNLVKIQAALRTQNYYYVSKWVATVQFTYDLGAIKGLKELISILGSVFFVGAYFAYIKRNQTLRAWISACPVDEMEDDNVTLVPGQHDNMKRSTLRKPTKLAFAENSSKSSFPVLTVDGKSIILS